MKRMLWGTVGLLLLVAFSAGVARADCADSKIGCVKLVNGRIPYPNSPDVKGLWNEGRCWKDWSCKFCRGGYTTFANECNAKFPACEGNCAACEMYPSGTGVYGPCYDKNGVKVYDKL